MCRIHPINFVCIAALAATAMADTTIDEGHAYAYGANIAWINMRGDVGHGAVITHFCCTGYVYSANCGWICLGHGPANGHEYGNDTADAISAYSMTSGDANAVSWTVIRPTRFYQLECRDLLAEGFGWEDSGLGVIAPANAISMTREVITDTSSTKFFRVRGLVPLSP